MAQSYGLNDVQTLSTSSSAKDSGTAEHEHRENLDVIRTISRVPGNTHYYEKDGLRTYGDGEAHDVEPPMTFRRIMSLIAMAFLWTGSQIPLYLFGKHNCLYHISFSLTISQVEYLL
jgi:hypothetical protein